MEKDITEFHKRQRRGRCAIYGILVLVAILVFGLVLTTQRINQEEALRTQSRANTNFSNGLRTSVGQTGRIEEREPVELQEEQAGGKQMEGEEQERELEEAQEIDLNSSPDTTSSNCGLVYYQLQEICTNCYRYVGAGHRVQFSGYKKATYRCVGDTQDRTALAVRDGASTSGEWLIKLNFYCQIPCAGLGVNDSCTQFTSVGTCDNGAYGNGIAGENCGWYYCANKCLTKWTPMDYACPSQQQQQFIDNNSAPSTNY